MPSYPRTVCKRCSGINATNTELCNRCRRECPQCGSKKGVSSDRCRKCYAIDQSENPTFYQQLHTSKARTKATSSLNNYFERTGHSKAKRSKRCPVCAADFTAPSQSQVHCSSKCAASVAGLKRRRRKIFTCKACSKVFEGAAFREAKYCSKACWSDRRKKKQCLNCGDTITSYTALKFCGVNCSKTYRVGKNAARWKDGKSLERERLRLGKEVRAWRIAVFVRDNHTCQQCGTAKDLHAHHVKHWATTPELRFDLDNGLTLCIDCHGIIHNKDFRKRLVKKRICPVCDGAMSGRGLTCRKCIHKRKRAAINLSDQLELALFR